MAARIIAYKDVNNTLATAYSPKNRCACKLDAVRPEAGGDDVYGAGFANNRLITKVQKSTVYWTITFNKQVDGVVSLIETRQVEDGQPISNPPVPTVPGYSPTGWSPAIPNVASQDATYTLIYEEDTPATRYTIEFRVPNDPKYGSYANQLIGNTQSLVEGEAIVDPRSSAPVITYNNITYHFVDWKERVPKYATSSATYHAVYSEDEIPGSALRYFTTVAEGNGSITFHISDAVDPSHPTWGVVNEVSYRVWDGSESPGGQRIYSNWTTVSNPKGQDITVPNLQNGYEVEWKGDSSGYGVGYYDGTEEHALSCQYSYFSSTCNMSIKNNLLTLLYNADADTISDIDDLWHLDSNSSYCFCGLFAGCTTLTSAHDLYISSFLDSGEHHFCDFFRDCTNLTTADFYCGDKNGGGSLLDSCYERMFLGCTSLVTPPHLPVMNLGAHCYQAMFSGCTSLVNAPELPAVNLVAGCYDGMFGQYPADGSTYHGKNYSGCTSLKSITMRATYYEPGNEPQEWKVTNLWGTSVVHPLRNWVKFVNSNGYQGLTDGHFYGDSGWKNVATNGQDEYYGAGISGCDGTSYVGVPYNWTKN